MPLACNAPRASKAAPPSSNTSRAPPSSSTAPPDSTTATGIAPTARPTSSLAAPGAPRATNNALARVAAIRAQRLDRARALKKTPATKIRAPSTPPPGLPRTPSAPDLGALPVAPSTDDKAWNNMDAAQRRKLINDLFEEVGARVQCAGCSKVGSLTLSGHSSARIQARCACGKTTQGSSLLRLLRDPTTLEPAQPLARTLDLSPSTPKTRPTTTTEPAAQRSGLEAENAELKATIAKQAETISRLETRIEELSGLLHSLAQKIDGNQTAPVAQPTAPKPTNTQSEAPPSAPINSQFPPLPSQAGERTRQPISWADVARTGTEQALPSDMQARFAKSRDALKAKGFNPMPRPAPRTTTENGQNGQQPPRPALAQPVPVPVYFAGVPRGPIGDLRRALLECMPKWCVLSLSFIGSSICEVLCHNTLSQRLIAGMKLLGFRHLGAYSALRPKADDALTAKLRTACVRRWLATEAKTFSPVAKTWYSAQAEAAMAADPSIREALAKDTPPDTAPATTPANGGRNTTNGEDSEGAADPQPTPESEAATQPQPSPEAERPQGQSS